MVNKCLCGGSLQHQLIKWEEYVSGHQLVIDNVPVAICEQCSKKYFNEDFLAHLEKERKRLAKKEHELEVRLEDVRKQKGLTQKMVAERIGVSTQRYNDIEKNRKKPNILLALRIAKALECDINDIYRIKD